MSITLHGSLVSVSKFGVLIIGESGTGKSEAALKLISKGHRLVADDVVEVVRDGNSLIGSAPPRLGGILEVRGIGFVDAAKLFGIKSVKDRNRVDLFVELVSPPAAAGIEMSRTKNSMGVLGIEVPRFLFAVGTNRDLALFIETATQVFANPQALVTDEEIIRKPDR